jgi:putative transposase
MDHRMKASLAVAALRNAIGLSFRGRLRGALGQAQPVPLGQVRRLLRSHGLVDRWGAPGPCADNAAKESFCALLQKNVLDRKRRSSREERRLPILTWIGRTYHRRRLKGTAGQGNTPGS